MARRYCETCKKAGKLKSIQKTEEHQILDDVVEAESQLVVCETCGYVFSRKIPDEETLLNAYRKKHKLLYPDEIRSIRQKYQLSIKTFSALMHWSDKTIRKYENGVLPDSIHNSMLFLLKNPENMKVYLENNAYLLPQKKVLKLLKRVDELTLPVSSHGPFFHRYFSDLPSEDNGYKGFDYHAASGMVLYFALKEENIKKMKLMSLLYYADMLYYQRYGSSMSGIRYVRQNYGAIAENMNIFFGIMEEDGLIKNEIRYTRKNEHHLITSTCEFPEGILLDSEMDVLREVSQRFSSMDTKDTVRCLRREKNYQSTKEGTFISYKNAVKMKWERNEV